jgi:Predicted methyltransferase (contains TPR repeat)
MTNAIITHAIILLLWTFPSLVSCQQLQDNDTPENLYRTTMTQWRTTQRWEPWHEYTHHLVSHLDRHSGATKHQENNLATSSSTLPLLDIVAALEEGILAIEKATVARGEGENPKRDATLSLLYDAYGQALMALDGTQCHTLAMDPHTLLIGVETFLGDNHEEEEGERGARTSGASMRELCRENAENALRNAVTLDATNVKAETHLGNVLGLMTAAEAGKDVVHKRKSKEFVAELFDSFAETFDEKLVKGLGYKVPQLIGEAAKELGRDRYGAVLDAGCGTGLAGRFLRPLVGDVMVGVDASSKMLSVASKCTIKSGCGVNEGDFETVAMDDGHDDNALLYDKLLVMDLEEMTLDNTYPDKENGKSGFDLIVAADVLVYFGSVSKLLKTFAQISSKDARLLFTTEQTSEEEAPLGWRLLPSGRFAHTKRHVVEAAQEAGYTLVLYREIVPRMERGQPVQGHLFGFVWGEQGMREAGVGEL